MTPLQIDTAPNADEMTRRAASFFCETLSAPGAVGAVCLSGGGTPRALYELLTRQPFAARLPWSSLHWFFGDERFVPPDDPRSNYRMVREALLSRAPIPASHVHPIPTVGPDVAQAADSYQRILKDFYGAEQLSAQRPLFDIVLLGLGPDGHTASLLPGRAEQDESERWVCAVPEGAPEPRVTLTRPPLESARTALFLVAGVDKHAALEKLRAGDPAIPAARIRPRGTLRAFVDAAAAG
jgi:6-phosphogluconolactonase